MKRSFNSVHQINGAWNLTVQGIKSQVTLSTWFLCWDLSELYRNGMWLVTVSDLSPVQRLPFQLDYMDRTSCSSWLREKPNEVSPVMDALVVRTHTRHNQSMCLINENMVSFRELKNHQKLKKNHIRLPPEFIKTIVGECSCLCTMAIYRPDMIPRQEW